MRKECLHFPFSVSSKIFFLFVKSIFKNFMKCFSEKVVKSQIYLFLITRHIIEVIEDNLETQGLSHSVSTLESF